MQPSGRSKEANFDDYALLTFLGELVYIRHL